MAEKRKMWRNVAIAMFVLAVALAFGNRFMPKPAVELESVVEQYLLTRTLFILGAGVMAFLGLLTIFNHLRCPHCGAFGLKQIQICTNCGKDLDAEVVEEISSGDEASETAENAKEVEAPAVAEPTEVSEHSEAAAEKE